MNMDDPFEMDAHQMKNELIEYFWDKMDPNFDGLGQNDKIVSLREVLIKLFRYAMGRYIDPNLDVGDVQRRRREHDIDSVILERDGGVVGELAPDEDEDDDNLNFILDHPQIAGLSCAVVWAMNHAGGRRRTRKGRHRRHRRRSHRRRSHRRRH